MQKEEGIYDDEQVMRVPERVEPHQPVEWPWQLDQAPTEPMSCQQEGDNHDHEHNHTTVSH